MEFDIGEKHLGLIVWENAFAATPLPGDLFRGPYDERWAFVGSDIRRVHVGTVVAEVFPESGRAV